MTHHQICKVLEENGWTWDRKTASHDIYVKENRRSIPVPFHGNKDLGDFGKDILRQAGVKTKTKKNRK
jgi:predicted RNA binding protein YcfA (HicA-like mRNA interferase family)